MNPWLLARTNAVLLWLWIRIRIRIVAEFAGIVGVGPYH